MFLKAVCGAEITISKNLVSKVLWEKGELKIEVILRHLKEFIVNIKNKKQYSWIFYLYGFLTYEFNEEKDFLFILLTISIRK